MATGETGTRGGGGGGVKRTKYLMKTKYYTFGLVKCEKEGDQRVTDIIT